MTGDFNILEKKVRKFIRKYYKNLMLKGVIYSASIILALFLMIDLIEYYAWSGVMTRTVIFYGFVMLVLLVLTFYVVIPGIKLAQIGKTLTDEQAAKIIGAYFPDVSDRLLNTLQLKHQVNEKLDPGELALLEASIDQRSAELKPVPFQHAIDLKKNVRHLRYFLPPLLVILVILIISPAFITEPSKRIVRHGVYFEKPLPYQVQVENTYLKALQHDDFTLKVTATGDAIPGKVNVTDGSFNYRMTETAPGHFEYTFKDINSDVYFNILTEDYKSDQYKIEVNPKPVIFSFDVVLDYPNYLNKKSELIENSGDIVVPEGSLISWKVYTKDTRRVIFKTDDTTRILAPSEGNVFKLDKEADKNFYYTLMASNEFVDQSDSMSFSVQVIRDEYPTIEVVEHKEESIYGYAFFAGTIGDDHGFRSLKFYHKKDAGDNTPWQDSTLRIDPSLPRQSFNFSVDALDFGLEPGEGVSYYFEVRDNDAVNGFKRAKSSTFYIHLPDEQELEETIASVSEKLKEEMKKAMDELDVVNQELEELKMSMFDKKELSWMDKKQISELLDKQQSLQEKIDQMSEMNQEMTQIEEFLEKTADQELTQKMEELEELFEQLSDEALQERMEELKKELEQLDKDELTNMMEQMKQRNEELKSNLEQNLELYKQLEFEKKLEETISKLEELSQEQKELAEETKEKDITEQESLKEQEEIKEKFESIEEDLAKTEELNQELEKPFDVNADQQDIDDVKSEMNEASENLNKGKQKKASENQQNSGQKMEEMASQLGMMMQSAMASRMGEDADYIKKLLDNLLDLSFNLEQLMDVVELTSQNDPKYIENIDQLKLINDDFSIVHDSLVALSKRQLMIKPFIIKESDKVINNINKGLNSMQERRKGRSLSEQQYAMTSMNNLALMLAESLNQMQQSMQMSGTASGMQCPNPGQAKPGSLDAIGKMQQELNQQMKGGKQQTGQEGQDGMNGNSEELARMAAQQSEIRRRLQQYIEEMETEGGTGNALQKLVEEMLKSEEDIVNRRISQETLERQKDIEVRLLKSEKARMEREKKKERESEEGKNRKRSNLTDQLEYKEKNEKQEDILITVPVELSPYYRALHKKYLYKMQKENGN
jgi:hypothetical protein